MSDRETPWFKFYPSDWQADTNLGTCSLGARGLWMELLSIMHKSERYGFLLISDSKPSIKQLAFVCRTEPKNVEKYLQELRKFGVLSETADGIIFSRRMVKDREGSSILSDAGSTGGNPNIRRGTVRKDLRKRSYRRSDAPAKTKRIFEKTEGCCIWCGVHLDENGEGQNAFQIDYIKPVCDGGNHDESNLVPSCGDCKNSRSIGKNFYKKPFRPEWRIYVPTDSDVNVGRDSDTKPDHKPHIPETRDQKERVPIPSESAPALPALPGVIIDVRTQLFRDGLEILRRLTGKSEGACRTFLGKLLREAGDDCELALRKLREAAETPPADPGAWLMAAVKKGSVPKKSAKTEAMEKISARLDAGGKNTQRCVLTIDGEAERELDV
jgi:hypothetical protein